jgi:hypothetical protein
VQWSEEFKLVFVSYSERNIGPEEECWGEYVDIIWQEEQDNWENHVMKSYWICILCVVLLMQLNKDGSDMQPVIQSVSNF